MFGDVMNTVSAFLAAHPREAVIMRIRADEHDPEPGSQDFNTIWANYLRTYGNRIARNVPAMPTLGSIRGKVLVLRNGWNDFSTGIDYGSSIFSIQDYYDVWFLAGDG